MSREIKFRVWSKENEIMLEWSDLLDAPDFEDFMKNAHKEDAYYSKLMQFTGLTDSKGVEIYEGDILKVNELTFESPMLPEDLNVEYYKGSFQLYRGSENLMGLHLFYLKDGEVIGNLHENLELQERESK